MRISKLLAPPQPPVGYYGVHMLSFDDFLIGSLPKKDASLDLDEYFVQLLNSHDIFLPFDNPYDL